jgi:hypothetical protein
MTISSVVIRRLEGDPRKSVDDAVAHTMVPIAQEVIKLARKLTQIAQRMKL